jgi:predicted  nucleic acid-binding Zn-ribbon protein
MSVSDSVVRRLHQILLQIADIQGQIDRGPRQIRAAQTQLEAAKTALAQCKEAGKQKRMEADRKQLQLREREAKLYEWQGKMNGAKNNREFQAIKDQIAADTQANSVLSDEILEALEALDELNSKSKELDERAKTVEADTARAESTIAAKLDTLRSELERVKANLAEAEAGLPEDFLADYRRLVATGGEDCMAPLDDKSCGGCNTNLPPRLLDKLRMGQPIPCSSCGRLMYRPE